MRSIASEVGVAHRALYNHFGDKAGLLAEIATIGFSKLASTLQRSTTARSHTKSYIRFALKNPALYGVMMHQSYPQFAKYPGLGEAVSNVINISLSTLTVEGDPDQRRREVMRVWMLAHGGVSLHQGGILRGRSEKAFVEEILLIAGMPADAGKPDGND